MDKYQKAAKTLNEIAPVDGEFGKERVVFINPLEEQILKSLGGSGATIVPSAEEKVGGDGVPSYGFFKWIKKKVFDDILGIDDNKTLGIKHKTFIGSGLGKVRDDILGWDSNKTFGISDATLDDLTSTVVGIATGNPLAALAVSALDKVIENNSGDTSGRQKQREDFAKIQAHFREEQAKARAEGKRTFMYAGQEYFTDDNDTGVGYTGNAKNATYNSTNPDISQMSADDLANLRSLTASLVGRGKAGYIDPSDTAKMESLLASPGDPNYKAGFSIGGQPNDPFPSWLRDAGDTINETLNSTGKNLGNYIGDSTSRMDDFQPIFEKLKGMSDSAIDQAASIYDPDGVESKYRQFQDQFGDLADRQKALNFATADSNQGLIDNVLRAGDSYSDALRDSVLTQANIVGKGYDQQQDYIDSGYNDQYNYLKDAFSDRYNMLDQGYGEQNNLLNQGFGEQYGLLDEGFGDQFDYTNRGADELLKNRDLGNKQIINNLSGGFDDFRDYTNKAYDALGDYTQRGFNTARGYSDRGYNALDDFTNRGFGTGRDFSDRSFDTMADYTGRGYDTLKEYTDSGFDSLSDYNQQGYGALEDFANQKFDRLQEGRTTGGLAQAAAERANATANAASQGRMLNRFGGSGGTGMDMASRMIGANLGQNQAAELGNLIRQGSDIEAERASMLGDIKSRDLFDRGQNSFNKLTTGGQIANDKLQQIGALLGDKLATAGDLEMQNLLTRGGIASDKLFKAGDLESQSLFRQGGFEGDRFGALAGSELERGRELGEAMADQFFDRGDIQSGRFDALGANRLARSGALGENRLNLFDRMGLNRLSRSNDLGNNILSQGEALADSRLSRALGLGSNRLGKATAIGEINPGLANVYGSQADLQNRLRALDYGNQRLNAIGSNLGIDQALLDDERNLYDSILNMRLGNTGLINTLGSQRTSLPGMFADAAMDPIGNLIRNISPYTATGLLPSMQTIYNPSPYTPTSSGGNKWYNAFMNAPQIVSNARTIAQGIGSIFG